MGYGRNVFGLAAIFFGVLNVASAISRPPSDAFPVPVRDALLYATALGLIVGGVAIQRKDAARMGAAALLAVNGLYCVFYVPQLIAAPLVYASWGNFGEQLALVSAAGLLFAGASPADRTWRRPLMQASYLLFAVCVVSFGLYQTLNVAYTASLVPKWIPPGQVFWVNLTTVAFFLAAIALFVHRLDVLAARLLALMLLLFQVLIWIPAVAVQPSSRGLWGENVQNFAIAASARLIADYLATLHSRGVFQRFYFGREHP